MREELSGVVSDQVSIILAFSKEECTNWDLENTVIQVVECIPISAYYKQCLLRFLLNFADSLLPHLQIRDISGHLLVL